MKKTIYFILIALLCCFTSLLLQVTLAKYRDKIDASINSNVANWNIKINNENINNKSVLINDIIPTFDSNQYMHDGVLAPGSTGYFDINIDATYADVTFDYAIDLSVDKDVVIPDLIVTSYKINDGQVTNYTNGITGTITHNTENTSIRIFIEWNDDTDNVMDNSDDTQIAIDYSNIIINASIRFNQKR